MLCYLYSDISFSRFVSLPGHPASLSFSGKLYFSMTGNAVNKESKCITRNLDNRSKMSSTWKTLLVCNLTGWEGFFSLCKELKPHLVWVLFTLRSETCDRPPCCSSSSTLGLFYFSDLEKIFLMRERERERLCVKETETENSSKGKAGAFLPPVPPLSFPSHQGKRPGLVSHCWSELQLLSVPLLTFQPFLSSSKSRRDKDNFSLKAGSVLPQLPCRTLFCMYSWKSMK